MNVIVVRRERALDYRRGVPTFYQSTEGCKQNQPPAPVKYA
jgi:hypothetical protein